MGILRSESMKHGTLVLPAENARHYLNLIGHNSSMQFTDANANAMIRPYRKYVQRIEEMERMTRFLAEEVRRVPECEDKMVRQRNDDFLEHCDDTYKLDSLEKEIAKTYDQFVRFRANNDNLAEELRQAIEEKHVVECAMGMLGGAQNAGSTLSQPLLASQAATAMTRDDGMIFANMAGVLNDQDKERFARTLFRATRGNTYTQFADITEAILDAKTGKELSRAVFVVYFQGGSSTAMNEKIGRICSAFGVAMYSWPQSKSEASSRLNTLNQAILDKQTALTGFQNFLMTEMQALVACPRRGKSNSRLEEWRLFCLKEKAIYATMNMFEGDVTLRANCWFPECEEDNIRQVLHRGGRSMSDGAAMLIIDNLSYDELVGLNPPTYNKKNDFTAAFQELVDTYGVPRYQEANPMLFTTVTFPFIFGIMYGDVGHGTILLLVGLYGIWNAESLRYGGAGAQALCMARYLLTMMGFFAVYAGFMYNDLLSLGMEIFTSRYEDPAVIKGSSYEMQPKPWFDKLNEGKPGTEGPYPFGVDPAWHGASNELIYVNSLKMKLSVLIGVTQMLLGVMLKFFNSVHFRSATDFVFECIPQLAFMLSFFFYMDYLIMYKWVTPVTQDPTLNGPPSIINTLISMGLGQEEKQPLFHGQMEVQAKLMLITVCSVPLMLIPKPVILYIQHKMQGESAHSDVEAPPAGDHGHGHGFALDEIVIHQIIETIEYVLGTVSHTASYLRQWALSLAHQQLSLVFFQKTLQPALESQGIMQPVYIFLGFAVFWGITSGVLLGMDVLECFLHTLRLHWVEFQSKFFKADGYSFAPFKHKSNFLEE